MSIKTPDNSLGEALAAILIMVYNPLTYRGYTFAPALSYNYYLGSRFYIPQLCRFMNADIYADTTQGVIGTNMFAYCNNNPISFVDPEGTSPITNLFDIFSKVINAVISIYKTIISNGGASSRNAMQIAIETSTYASITKSNEIDWFKFTTKYSGAYNIYTENEVDTKIELCTRTIFGRENILFSNDNSGQGNNARIECELKSNKQYYIKVSSTHNSTGIYKLTLESNYDNKASPSGGSWLPNSMQNEPYGELRFEKKVFLTKNEAQAYYIMVTNDELRKMRDDLVNISFSTVSAVLYSMYPNLLANEVIEFIVDNWLEITIPTLTELELNEIAKAGNLTNEGYMQNGIVITCISYIVENMSGEKLREYSDYYNSWDGNYIYGERYYRGNFDVNDKTPF